MLSEVDAAAAAAADVPVVPAEAVEVVAYAGTTALANADAPRRGVLIEFLVNHAPSDRCECHRSGQPIANTALAVTPGTISRTSSALLPILTARGVSADEAAAILIPGYLPA